MYFGHVLIGSDILWFLKYVYNKSLIDDRTISQSRYPSLLFHFSHALRKIFLSERVVTSVKK